MITKAMIQGSSQGVETEPEQEEALEALFVLLKRLVKPSWASSPAPSAPDPWLTPADAATYTAVSEDTLRAWITGGLLPVGRVGSIIRIRRCDIDALLTSRAGASAVLPDRNDSNSITTEPASETTRAILKSLGPHRRKKHG